MDGLKMKYFVLKPTMKDAYGQASIAAIRRYAIEIRRENRTLSTDLENWMKHILKDCDKEI